MSDTIILNIISIIYQPLVAACTCTSNCTVLTSPLYSSSLALLYKCSTLARLSLQLLYMYLLFAVSCYLTHLYDTTDLMVLPKTYCKSQHSATIMHSILFYLQAVKILFEAGKLSHSFRDSIILQIRWTRNIPR